MPVVTSWQLENEALLKSFGDCPDGDYSHRRLAAELQLVKLLDRSRPVVMSLSDSWGFPFFGPRPDAYAMSLYRITINRHGAYNYSKRRPDFYRGRAGIIHLLKQRPVFIHEMQAEPWLPRALTEVPVREQLRYMNPTLLSEIFSFALGTGMRPIDLWGLEWWYWLKEKHRRPGMWRSVRRLLQTLPNIS
jgi:hypothetical protein